MLAHFIPTSGRISIVGVTVPGMGILHGIAWVSYRMEDGKVLRVNLGGNCCVSKSEQIADVHGTGNQQVIRLSTNRAGVELVYRINNYEQQPFLLFQLAITNHSLKPVHLQEFCLFQADPALGGRLEMPDAGNGLRFYKVGWHAWAFSDLRTSHQNDTGSWMDSLTRLSYTNPATPRPRQKGEFWSEGWGVLASGKVAVVAGFVSTVQQFGQVYACTRHGQEALKLSTQADDIQLDPGETCTSEWAFLQFVSLPNPEITADYVKAVGRQMHARVTAAPPAPMWTHWYHYYHSINENLFLQNVEALAKVHPVIPYQVVELDDGYQTAWGDWTSTNSEFPHGLEWLARQVRAHGFTPGLWLAPLVVEGKSLVAREHPDWLIKDHQGQPIKAGFFYYMNIHALDASHPAVRDHLYQLIDKVVNRWGYGMLKLDFLNAGALPGKRYNPKLTRAQSLRLGLETIRQAAGEDTLLLASGCPFGPAIGLVDAMRISPDTAPRWEPNLHWLGWARPLFRHNLSMPALRNSLRHTLNLSTLHQRWWWNDPDCLLVRNRSTRLSAAEVQSAVTLIGLSGGMLISSDDLRKVSQERLHWISLLTPNLGLRGLPVDWLESAMPALYRAKLDLAGWQGLGWQLVALFNWTSHKAACRLPLSRLGYSPGMAVHVFDFWTQHYYRTTEPELLFPGVPAHGCKLLRISPVGVGPQLVGDTLHISQGLELTSWVTEGRVMTIETCDLGRQADGGLWIWLPMAPHAATCNSEPVPVEDMGEGVYCIPVQFYGKASLMIQL